jgi:hypothetical protein
MEEKSQQSEAQMYVHGTFSLLMLDVTCTSVLVAVGCSSTVVYSYRELSELRSMFDNSENCCASWTLKWTSSEVIRMKMVVAVCRSSSQFFRVRTRTRDGSHAWKRDANPYAVRARHKRSLFVPRDWRGRPAMCGVLGWEQSGRCLAEHLSSRFVLFSYFSPL